mmetsp:Transcript_270/g.788  ORF Transcript_270/g.788 Transcript_270/m.788 type:complete len:207 (+) Transcript_270:800-1420(+)
MGEGLEEGLGEETRGAVVRLGLPADDERDAGVDDGAGEGLGLAAVEEDHLERPAAVDPVPPEEAREVGRDHRAEVAVLGHEPQRPAVEDALRRPVPRDAERFDVTRLDVSRLDLSRLSRLLHRGVRVPDEEEPPRRHGEQRRLELLGRDVVPSVNRGVEDPRDLGRLHHRVRQGRQLRRTREDQQLATRLLLLLLQLPTHPDRVPR